MRTTGSQRAARARVVAWPRRADIAQIVLTDHHMVPTETDLEEWFVLAAQRGARLVRTNALFPEAAEVFRGAGFTTADTLALMELDLAEPPPGVREATRRTRRMRPADLAPAAEIDRHSFGDDWSNDVESLAEIQRATPYHRSRVIRENGRLEAFAVSGRAGQTGYLQRIAVDPVARRRGHARALVVDALGWMARRGVHTVLVNTTIVNTPALALYHGLGFRECPERIRIMERAVARDTR